MFENRNLKHDLFALALLALVVFCGLALLTYDAADPVPSLVPPLNALYQADTLVYPQNDLARNVCGHWGALAADILLTALGWGAYYTVFSLGVLDVMLLRRRVVDAPLLRGAGWAASLAGITTMLAMLPGPAPGPVVGPGGYLGALGSSALEAHFATIGGVILALSVTLVGLLLSTDYALFRLATGALRTARGVARRLRGAAPRLSSRRAAAATGDAGEREEDVEEDDDADAEVDEQELSVRIRGQRVGRTQEPGRAEEQDADDEDLVEQVETGVAGADGNGKEVDDSRTELKELVVKGKRTRMRADRGQAGPPARARRAADQNVRNEVMERLEEASRAEETDDYELPDINLLIEGDDVCFEEQAKEVRRKARILERTFADFGFQVKVVEIETGPVIAQFEVALEAGLRLSKITGLADDLAIALRVPSVRIVAPIPGKNTVGIEVPNEIRQVVRLREVIEESDGKTKKMRIPIFLGKDVSGNPLVVDLSTLPHLLIAGRTGTGKSVCLNAIISSILMTRRPDEVRMLMIDPKMVELCGYGRLPHLMHPVVTDMRKAEAILAWAVDKMEERYSLLAKAGVRHITSYNQLGEEELIERLQIEDEQQRTAIPIHLPFIVIVADEMADLMMTAGKEVEQHIIRLAQKSRAVGIHLILATQKPTVDVITGLIKSNLPARIAFQVASRTDSRVVLDEMGADKLLGNGDMLFLWPGTSTLLRGQGTYLSDDEINSIVDSVSTGEQHFVNELVNIQVDQPDETATGNLKKRDELYESAVDIVIREGRGSVSLLQRSLGIGYGRAARLVDFMAEDGIVGQYAGSQAREVLISLAQWERMQGAENGATEELEPPPPRKRSNKIVPVPSWDDEEDPPPVTTRRRRTINPHDDDEQFDDDEIIEDEQDDEAHDYEDEELNDEDEYEHEYEYEYDAEEGFEAEQELEEQDEEGEEYVDDPFDEDEEEPYESEDDDEDDDGEYEAKRYEAESA